MIREAIAEMIVVAMRPGGSGGLRIFYGLPYVELWNGAAAALTPDHGRRRVGAAKWSQQQRVLDRHAGALA